MAGYNITFLSGLTEHSDSSLGNISVAGAVEAVAANLVLLVIFIGKRVHIRKVGHCLVE